MKRYFLTLAAFLGSMSLLPAQDIMVLKLSDGSQIEKYVWEIDEISFKADSNPLKADALESVDLGLSVEWASSNILVGNHDDGVLHAGWGDPSGKVHSTNLSYFPMQNPSKSISGSDYDIAKVMLGDKWRLPSDEEIQELINECDWSNANNVWTVTSRKNQNSIEIAVTDSLWTGNLSSSDSQKAWAMVSPDGASKPTLAQVLRSTRIAVRPVYGDAKIKFEYRSLEETSITGTSASLSISVDGDLAKVTEFGVVYSTSRIANPSLSAGTKKLVSFVSSNPTVNTTLSGLDYNTTYYYFSYAKVEGEYFYSPITSFQTDLKFARPDAPIDLGLSVKWSPWDMGAIDVLSYGGYYTWGDATGDMTTYPNHNGLVAFTDISGTDKDIAHVQWGGEWRMPTSAEIEELHAKCVKTWYQDYRNSGVGGCEFKGPNGNVMFVPFGGYYQNGVLQYKNSQATQAWWSASISENRAPICIFARYPSYINVYDQGKSALMAVRPVYGANDPSNISGGGSGSTGGGTTPSNPSTDEPSVPDTPTQPADPKADSSPVDLGLPSEVLWARYNLGAPHNKPEEEGYIFRWGETTDATDDGEYYPKNHSLLFNTITDTTRVIKNGVETINVTHRYQYSPIGYHIAGKENDAARQMWKGSWRMPTKAEFQELIDNCTFTYDDERHGYVCKSNINGKSIFFAAFGYKYDDDKQATTTRAVYWSESLYDQDSGTHALDRDWPYMLDLRKTTKSVVNGQPNFACPIRPVRYK